MRFFHAQFHDYFICSTLSVTLEAVYLTCLTDSDAVFCCLFGFVVPAESCRWHLHLHAAPSPLASSSQHATAVTPDTAASWCTALS
mmetsp:Transcript_37067/g.77486  ORF Transcript_37067/g.77486 Transcript_37067/m.77486 type:complete len:86 (+) Transcript_37067:745-1002(+)